MENRKVKVISTIDATVGIDDPQVRFSRTWDRKGTIREIDFDTLQELSYNVGVWNMFLSGILYIDDMEAKIALGLEEEGTEEPTNVIVLTDKQRERYLKVAPLHDLKEICAKLSKTEIDSLIDYAVEHEIINYDKCTYLKQLTGKDIIKMIESNRA